MRLIRGVLRPANSSLCHQVIKNSSACLHPVLVETSNLVDESNIQWRGRSYAASVSSDTLEAGKARRRVPKVERKSMVEDYVKKYRKLNAGKFPTVSDARKDVGGSYYVVRQILQELKHNSEMLSMDTKDANSLERSAVKKNSSSKSFGPKEGPRSSFSVESHKSKDVRTQSHRVSGEFESSQHSGPENNVKLESIHEDKLKFDGLQPKAEPQEPTESEISKRESHKVPTEEAEPQRKSSVWQNLKSFANGILGVWKRS